jgi:hypothetical protein
MISKVHYQILMSMPPDPIPSQSNQVWTHKHYFVKIHFNNIFPFTIRFPNWSLSCKISDIFVNVFLISSILGLIICYESAVDGCEWNDTEAKSRNLRQRPKAWKRSPRKTTWNRNHNSLRAGHKNITSEWPPCFPISSDNTILWWPCLSMHRRIWLRP